MSQPSQDIPEQLTGEVTPEAITAWIARTSVTCASADVNGDMVELIVGWGLAGRPEYTIRQGIETHFSGYSIWDAVRKYNRIVAGDDI